MHFVAHKNSESTLVKKGINRLPSLDLKYINDSSEENEDECNFSFYAK